MSVKIVGDVGSTHMGNIEYCFEAVDLAGKIGLDTVKFQLFPDTAEYTTTGNVVFPLPWNQTWVELMQYAKDKMVDITASVFSRDALEILCKTKPNFIKFGYGMKEKTNWQSICQDNYGIQTIVSCDVMTAADIYPKAKKLYCIPEYPVRYLIDFSDIFPRFYGFSDHTLGTKQTLRAVSEGALMVEKHVRLDHMDVKCPDAAFALTFPEMEKLINKVKK